MKIFSKTLHIDFLSYKKIGFTLSVAMIAATIAVITLQGGLKYGIDFAGGSLIQVKFKDAPILEEVRRVVGTLELGKGDIQGFGEPEDILINIKTKEGEHTAAVNRVKQALIKRYGEDGISIERVEMVGPKVGSDLSTKAILSLVYSLIGILIYISYRFELRFAVAAVIALAHDTILTVGALSVTGSEFTLPVIAALLTVIGYSLNDTIVVFDRIRENLRLKRTLPIEELVNVSINQTLGRTIITSGTTMIVVLCIFLFGGSVIHEFSFALIVGIIVGTYSSIFIASPLLAIWPGTTTQTLSLAVRGK